MTACEIRTEIKPEISSWAYPWNAPRPAIAGQYERPLNTSYWPAEYADRNQAVARQRLTGSNAYWKWNTAYNRRSVAETAMYRVKQLFGGHLTLRDYDAQVGEAMAMIRALNKMTRAGMPESVRIA